MNRKGIILAGGHGTRLYPLTKSISKHLLAIYDKPMIYYPISTLMLSGIKDIIIISTPHDMPRYQMLLGDGSQWGLNFDYIIQEKPEGLPQAFTLSKDFVGNNPSALILGDNIFYGHEFTKSLPSQSLKKDEASIFVYHVDNPESFGVVELKGKTPISIEEKPLKPKSNLAITGLYFFDNKAADIASSLTHSKRGELEIIDMIKIYKERDNLSICKIGRGNAWLDTGTHDAMLSASHFVSTLQNRQGLKISSPEEISWRMGWIDDDQLENLAHELIGSGYGKYLMNIMNKEV